MNCTVIIPTYNEREDIEALIIMIQNVAPTVRVLVVDDNSPDKTYEIVERIHKHNPLVSLLLRKKKEGLGKAYTDAFQHVLDDGWTEAIITMDADFSHDPAYIPSMIQLSTEYDLVVGSRYISGGGTSGWETWRRMLSKYGNIYARTIMGLSLYDCTAGFNLIKTSYLRKVDFSRIDMSGYAFQMESKYMLIKAGARFVEIPIIFKNRVHGESKISNSIIREGILAPWRIRRK